MTMNISNLILLIFFTVSPILAQQMSKFDKWQQPTYFKGFCISDWNNLNETYVAQQEFDNLKATGANLVVIQTGGISAVASPYGPAVWYTDGVETIYWQDVLDDMVGFARNAGLQYVIGVRSGPGRIDVAEDEGGSTVWTNVQEQKLYGKMLKNIAERYLPDDLFVGLDLTVEPNPHGELAGEPVEILEEALSNDGIDVNAINSIWIDSVRTAAPDLPLMVQGVHWANPAYFSLVEKQVDTKIVYKIHCYNPFDYSHAGTAFAETYPGMFWSDATQEMETFNRSFFENSVFLDAKNFQNSHNVPFIIGEFGVSIPQNGGEQYLSDLMIIAENYGWHYSLWNWNNTEEFNYVHHDQSHGTHYMDSILVHFSKSPSDVGEPEVPVKNFNLQQNYPNPFNPNTSITYSIIRSGIVELSVFNPLGEKLALLVNEHQNRGEYTVSFDASDLPSGIYFYKLIADGYTKTRKMVLLR